MTNTLPPTEHKPMFSIVTLAETLMQARRESVIKLLTERGFVAIADALHDFDAQKVSWGAWQRILEAPVNFSVEEMVSALVVHAEDIHAEIQRYKDKVVKSPDLSDQGPYATGDDAEVAEENGLTIEELRRQRATEDLLP